MPRRNSLACPGILQGLVLQPLLAQSQLAAQREQAVAVRAHEMHHRLAPQPVAMKPNAAVQGEAHPLAAACELPVGALYWQRMRPSIIPPMGGVAGPGKRQHLCVVVALDAVADHPAGVASLTDSV